MADTRKIVKVFLASPGDLPDERRAANAVVDEFNKLWADALGYHVELVGWEDTVSRYGRPQELINQDLDQCELFIGMMWKKWGTPPGIDGGYTSGFEEEFERSIRKRTEEGRPEISLLFKQVDPDLLDDPGGELRKVMTFKEKIIAQKTVLFETFSDVRDLEGKIRSCITNYVQRLRDEEAKKASGASQVQPETQPEPKPIEGARTRSETPLSKQGAQFLRDFVAKTERDPEQEPIELVEVARFRLLANIIGRSGNDRDPLGVHDANLLFDHRSQLELSQTEVIGLMRVGLEHCRTENAPLWYWLVAVNGFARMLLPLYAHFQSSTESQVGALAAMRIIGEPLPSSPGFPIKRSRFLDAWFGEDSPSEIRVAALDYLGECGIEADLPTLRKEFDRGNYSTTGPAVDAIIRINLRDSRAKAIKALYELQPSSINESLVSILFSDGESLSTSLLKEGITHRNSIVRRNVVRLLRNRGELSPEMAEPLLADADAGSDLRRFKPSRTTVARSQGTMPGAF
jgi:hypothetical protein